MFGKMIMVLFGLGFLGFAVYLVYRGTITRRFQKTEGKVISSELKRNYDDDGVSYEPLVHYEYSVEGKAYQNSVYSTAPIDRLKKVQRILSYYEPGKIITVFYNPGKPEDSVLQVGISTGNMIGIIVISSLLFYALVEMFFL